MEPAAPAISWACAWVAPARLNLSSNALSELPSGLVRLLPRLRLLDLSRNAFVELSDELLRLLLAPVVTCG
jgi:hypothetical protein